MAQGYVDVPHSTYAEWKNNTLGYAYDLDGSYGCQCWDYASLFWRNIGFPAGYPLTGPLSYASECWSVSRNSNASYNSTTYFDLITDLSDVITGDIIILDGDVNNPPGHIAFADEDYNGTNYLYCIGQNQGGPPDPSGGTPVTRNNLGMSLFLGAFRYKGWNDIPPPPPIVTRKSNFKWVLYARKLNDNRKGNVL